MLKIFISFVILFLLLAGNSPALTWREALNQAALKSNDIKSALKQVEASKWEYYKAYSPFLPQLSANLSSGQSTALSTTTKSNSFGLTLSQSLFKGLSNYYNLQSASKNYDYDQANLQKIKSDVYYDLRVAFIDVFIAQDKIDVAKEILRKRSENARMINLLYDSGKEDKGNYLRTKAQFDEAQYNLDYAKREFELARYKLAQILENDINKIDGRLEIKLQLFDDTKLLAETSPSFALAKYQFEMAEISRKSSVSEFLPSITLQGSYQKSGSDWPPQTSNKSLILNMSYSIFPGGSNISDYMINSAKLDKAREDFEISKKDIYYNVKMAFKNINDSISAFELQKTFLNASAERAKIAQAKYLNGIISYDEWDRLQSEYISFKSSFISSRKSALYAEANWHKSYGGWIK